MAKTQCVARYDHTHAAHHRRRRRSQNVAGLQNMQIAAGAVSLWGPEILDRLPNGFDSVMAGQNKQWWKNKRVLIIIALLAWTIQHDKLKWRLWSIPLTALLTLAITQHKVTYGGPEEADLLVETYE